MHLPKELKKEIEEIIKESITSLKFVSIQHAELEKELILKLCSKCYLDGKIEILKDFKNKLETL